MVTKLKNSNGYKTQKTNGDKTEDLKFWQKIKMWQNYKTQKMSKLKL